MIPNFSRAIFLKALSLVWLLFIISACGGGGGGMGGGLIPGMMTMNTTAVLSGGEVQLSIDGGLAPYSFSIYQGVGGTMTAPYGGVTIDSSGTIAVPDIGDDIDVIIVKVVDDMKRTKYFRVPVLGKPLAWLRADKIVASSKVGDFVKMVPDQSENGGFQNAEVDGLDQDCEDHCPRYIGSDALLNGLPSLYFDGTDDYLRFANGLTGDFTIALVFRSANGSGTSGDWSSESAIIRHEDFGISLSDEISSSKIDGGTDLGTLTNSSSLQTGFNNNYGHIVLLTRTSGGDMQVFVDGVGQASAASGSDSVAAGYTFLGSNITVDGNFFIGAIPEIFTYSRDLSTDEVDRITLTRYLKERYAVSLPNIPDPTVTIDSGPTDGASYTVDDFTFAYTYLSNGYADLETVECQLTKGSVAGAWGDCSSPDLFADNYTKEYLDLEDNNYTFTIRVTDTDEKTATATRSWLSDSTAPVCIITSPEDGGWTYTSDVTVTAECLDFSPITAQCTLIGSGAEACTSVTASGAANEIKTYSITYDITGLTTGMSKTVEVEAVDDLGNGPGDTASVTWSADLEPPTCTITSAPSGVRTTNSETIQFSCSDVAPATLPAGYKVQCSLDGAAYSDCDSNTQHDLTGLSASTHTLSIKVEDQSEQWSAVQSATWITDLNDPVCTFTTEPGAFGGLDPQVIEFSCTDDTDSALTVLCSLDGGAYGACTSNTTFNVTNDTEGHVYTVKVQATDHASKTSAEITTSWTCDLTDPVCSIDVGTSAGYDPPQYDPTATVYYECSDSSGAMPMDRADCSLDGAAFETCSSTFSAGTGTKTGSHYMSGLSGGNHTLAVRGYDSAGRHHEVSHTFRNDIGRPTCTIVTAISGDRNNASESIDVRCDDDLAFNDPSDNNPHCLLEDITTTATTLYDNDCGATTFGGAYNALATYDTGALTDGHDYRLTVTITDSGGKVPVTDAVTTWTTDVTAPTCTITTSPDGLVHTWNYEDIAYMCDDDSLDFTPQRSLYIECEIDGGGYTECDSYSYMVGTGDVQGTHQFPGLLAGDHTLKIRATDSSGNVSTESVSVTTADFTTDLADPVCSITGGPAATGAGYSNVSTPTFNYTCTDDNDTDNPRILTDYECLLDDVVIGTGCTAMTYHTLAALAGDGQYKFDVRVTDVAGKVSAAESLTWDYDATLPTCSITSGQSGYISSPNETFTFSCSDPTVNSISSGITNVSQYECALDDNSGGWATCSSATSETYAVADGPHTFYLRVTDDAGNLSNEYDISWITDDTAPTVDSITLSRPACTNCQTGYTDAEAISVAYTYTDSYPQDICISENSSMAACSWDTDYTTPNAFSLSSSDGVKTIYVWFRDLAQNTSTVLTDTIELDKSAPNTPTVSIDSGATYTNALGVSVAFTSTDTNGNSSDVCHRTDTTLASCSWTTNVGSPDSFTINDIADGAQTIYSWIRDKAGNVSNYGSDSIILDRTNPTCSISTSGGYKTSTTVGITFSCSDATSGVSTRQCQVDTGGWSTCSTATTHSFSGLSQGAHTLYVRSIDNAGNTGAADSIAVTVDTVAPAVSITSTARVSGTTRRVNFTTSDATSGVGTIQCQTKNGSAAWTGWGSCTASTYHNVTVTTGNTIQFQVRVYDNAGNGPTTSATVSDEVLYNARSSAECVAIGGTSGFGSHNYCQVSGTTCSWSIVSRKYNALTCSPTYAASGTSSCTTNSTNFYTSAPTCSYTENDNWSWSSYGNPNGYTTTTLSTGTTTSAAASCNKTAYTTPCVAWGTSVDAATDCTSPGRCCRTACSANNSSRTCTATTVNTVRCQ